eukprot:TRINITY_DN16717_c0_g1_i1.p1 TRINITY_DN16717_c0_g1~~TRINITY_DN16717_c0_g1_i1.p1  ORF type:complete len:122 (-),score=3.81 TRINITY_DN16717_c0_g1_i1:128-493(-)
MGQHVIIFLYCEIAQELLEPLYGNKIDKFGGFERRGYMFVGHFNKREIRQLWFVGFVKKEREVPKKIKYVAKDTTKRTNRKKTCRQMQRASEFKIVSNFAVRTHYFIYLFLIFLTKTFIFR